MTRRASPTKTFRFGPGYTESLTVRVWTKRGSGGDRKVAHVTGHVMLAREIDYDRFDVDETFDAWRGESNHSEDARLVWAAAGGDHRAAELLAIQAVEYAIEEAA